MNTLEAISARRSIRRFKDKPVPRELIEKLLQATMQAPSGKNRQPWRFVVVAGQSRDKLIQLMQEGIERLRGWGVDIGSAEWTMQIMAHAPATILIFNAESKLDEEHPGPQRYPWSVNIQSIGGAIQTMLLAAQELGLGTLWICDIFCADHALQEWLGRDQELVAAVSIGYADEAPAARPRMEMAEVVEWKA